jgi:hypothetical protein
MPNPFRSNPVAALNATQSAIVHAEERIAQLQVKRAALIDVDSELDLTAIAKIDRDIESERTSVAVHSDRISALQARCREQELARKEEQKAAGIAAYAKLLAKRAAGAKKFDAGQRMCIEGFAEMLAADREATVNYPPGISPLGRLPHYSLDAFPPLSAQRRQRPPTAGHAREFAEHEFYNFAEAIERQNNECIELLRAQPIVERDVA